jgi:hypothetical protein
MGLENDYFWNVKNDDLVKSPKNLFFVIPAKAGIQYFHRLTKNLNPVFQRGDDFLRDRQELLVS